ncbi:hypothetical protein ACFV1C_00170 [Streptomyces sp. NPDC059605]|uniref:hypothetical protein n=1 Tax=Streptomyces sp. NPDC059605 TaxID=3346882 RepID=UPI0036A96A10
MATTPATQYAPAQVGNGRTAHKTDAGQLSTDTLCERTVTRVLTAEQAAKMKECVSCNRIAEERAAAPAEQGEVPAPAGEAPTVKVEEAEEGAAAEEASVDVVRLTVRSYRRAGGSVAEQRALLHVNCDCKLASTLKGTFDNLADARALAAELVPDGPALGECSFSKPLTQAPAEEPVVEEDPAVEEPTAPTVTEEEVPEVGDEPAAEEAPAEGEVGQVEVTAYTAAAEQLYLNGQDDEDRTLRTTVDDLPEVLPTLRRHPRWNADQGRFTVNKVALILARGADGEQVWVRGEADPIRVDATGAPVDADAPAGRDPVDVAAVLAATRLLRRRREVQRVIDNREAARAWSAPTPAAEAPAPAPEEVPAPAVEAPKGSTAAPQWRTLKGLEAPFTLYGEEVDGKFRPANDREQCTGEPLLIIRTWMGGGTRYAEDAQGRKVHLGGVATKYWAAPTA